MRIIRKGRMGINKALLVRVAGPKDSSRTTVIAAVKEEARVGGLRLAKKAQEVKQEMRQDVENVTDKKIKALLGS